jgi:capsular polysaccharide biosynthesis protein
MSDQPLDLRRSMQVIRRRWIAVSLVVLIGLGAGVGYTEWKPPLLSSNALVSLSPTASNAAAASVATQEVIADSQGVLGAALPHVSPPGMTYLKLKSLVKVSSLSTSIMSITASGKTARDAQQTANAVTNSYVAFVGARTEQFKVTAQVLTPASTATGHSKISVMILTGILGGLLGLIIGAIGALSFGRRDRRLRSRDEIADAIGVPVLASLPVVHATDAAHWIKLLDEYAPSVADAWRLRNALQYLGLFDTRYPQARHHGGQSVTVVSLSTDKRALALGPQLGVSTVLSIARNEESSITATLRVACTAQAPKRSGNLRMIVADHEEPDWQSDARLTVVVAVVDARNPAAAAAPTSVTILGVTAGAATADQLARVAASAAAHGSSIDGILIGDPDPTDPTTGRIPQLVRPARNVQPTRLSGISTETLR